MAGPDLGDPNDAFSVAVAALRSPRRRQVRAEDHAAVLKMRAKRHRDLADAYRLAFGQAVVNQRRHFSMLIAQLGHITEIAATDWLTPNPRSPRRTDSEAWVNETFAEPHTRELLETILTAAR